MPKGKRKADPSKVARKRATYKRSLERTLKGGSNPFNRIVTKNLRNSVLGQKVKGAVKRPGHSLFRGVEKRKKTLLKDYEAVEDNQLNTVIDRRYEATVQRKLAEKSGTVKTDAKIASEKRRIEEMMAKINRQRQMSKSRKHKFNLEGDIDDDLVLTHKGKDLDQFSFDTANIDMLSKLEAEAADSGELPPLSGLDMANILKWVQSGRTLAEIKSELGVPKRYANQTRPQRIREKMVTARYYKCLHVIESQQILDSTDKLDVEFAQVLGDLKMQKPSAKRRRTIEGESTALHGTDKLARFRGDADADLEEAKRELEMGIKARASNNQLSALEKANAMRANLEALEKKRLKKVHGKETSAKFDSDDSDAEDDKDTDVWQRKLEEAIAKVELDSDLSTKERKRQTKKLKKEFAKKAKKAKKRRGKMEFIASSLLTSEKPVEDSSVAVLSDSNDSDDAVADFEMADGSEDDAAEMGGHLDNAAFDSVFAGFESEHKSVDFDMKDFMDYSDSDEEAFGGRTEVGEAEDAADDSDISSQCSFGDGHLGAGKLSEFDFEVDSMYMPRGHSQKKRQKRKLDSKIELDDGAIVEHSDSDDDSVDSEFEDVQFGAEGLGDDSIFDSMRRKEMDAETQRKSQNRKAIADSTKDWDEIDASGSGHLSKRRRASEMASASGSGDDDCATADWWQRLAITERCDLIGEGLESVPFTISVPTAIDDFESVLLGKSPGQQISILKRMRSANHVRLNEAKNRAHMRRMYDLCLGHLKLLCSSYEPKYGGVETEGELRDGSLALSTATAFDAEWMRYVDVMTRALFALSHDIPQYAYQCHVKKLQNIAEHLHSYYNTKLNERFLATKHSANGSVSTMPSAFALMYLKLVQRIFPAEDKRRDHVNTCLTLLLCKCVSEVACNGLRDTVAYLFCLTLLLDIAKTAADKGGAESGGKHQRFIPEVVNGLVYLLRAGFSSLLAAPKSDCGKRRVSKKHAKAGDFDLAKLRESDALRLLFRATAMDAWSQLGSAEGSERTLPTRLPLRLLFERSNDSPVFVGCRKWIAAAALRSTLALVREASDIWKGFLAYSEVFAPIVSVLSHSKVAAICKAHCGASYGQALAAMKSRMAIQRVTRRPLQLIKKAVALQMYEPEFDADLKPSFLRLNVRNERALEKKRARMLKKAGRKQEKALMRELAKDTQFVMAEKTKRRLEGEAKLKAKWVDEYRSLMEQARDTNAFQMVGKKLRKRMIREGQIRGY